jgi:Tol biopolymer transport system component
VYFSSNRSGAWEIWKMSPDGGPSAQVTKLGGKTVGEEGFMDSFESLDGKFLYYRRDQGIWRIPTQGGEVVRILKHAEFAAWRVFGNGIAFLDETTKPAQLKLVDADSGRITKFGAVDLGPTGSEGFDVSPDGQWVLYDRVDEFDSDIMLVENFH